MEYWFAVRAETLEYLTSQDRAIFFPIFLIFYIISFFANICAIYVTYNRYVHITQYNFVFYSVTFQKTSLDTEDLHHIFVINRFNYSNCVHSELFGNIFPSPNQLGKYYSPAVFVLIVFIWICINSFNSSFILNILRPLLSCNNQK